MATRSIDDGRSALRCIAFHLPQFHPIPENDAWWGKGFTEWTNVASAKPVVPGHHQPHLPADLGFYDLRLPECRAAQADLARQYGVDAFCYYHYWFSGRRVLQRPVDEIVASGQPDFPFCLCWANENWTHAWDGRSGKTLLEQHYSDADDWAHIHHLLPILADGRYLRVAGRPILLVYRTELMPNPRRTAELWRSEAIRAGIGDLYLVRVESFQGDIDPGSMGFDAALEFAPDWRRVRTNVLSRMRRLAAYIGLQAHGYLEHRFAEYDDLVAGMLAKAEPGYRRIRCVTPGFDNSPRRRKDALIIGNSTPAAYGRWLKRVLEQEAERPGADDEKLVFVNAWNEWAEGNHLEPCQRWGRGYLEAHAEALRRARV
jgi:lipopolysaccharide biosynthesis protein